MEVLVSEEAQGQSAMADVFRLLELWACGRGAKEVPGLVLDRLRGRGHRGGLPGPTGGPSPSPPRYPSL